MPRQDSTRDSTAPRKTGSVRKGKKRRTEVAADPDVVQEHLQRTNSWDTDEEIPPLEVNELNHPCGDYWRCMKNWAFEKASNDFEWHLDWNKQCELLKANFLVSLRKKFPGLWDTKEVMHKVGGNIRSRRNRLKREFKKRGSLRQVSIPANCTKHAWRQIWEDLRDPKKCAKAQKCKLATEARLEISGFAHRCGRNGYDGIDRDFVSSSTYFSGRSPFFTKKCCLCKDLVHVAEVLRAQRTPYSLIWEILGDLGG
jgi:hypothetical protein